MQGEPSWGAGLPRIYEESGLQCCVWGKQWVECGSLRERVQGEGWFQSEYMENGCMNLSDFWLAGIFCFVLFWRRRMILIGVMHSFALWQSNQGQTLSRVDEQLGAHALKT